MAKALTSSTQQEESVQTLPRQGVNLDYVQRACLGLLLAIGADLCLGPRLESGLSRRRLGSWLCLPSTSLARLRRSTHLDLLPSRVPPRQQPLDHRNAAAAGPGLISNEAQWRLEAAECQLQLLSLLRKREGGERQCHRPGARSCCGCWGQRR